MFIIYNLIFLIFATIYFPIYLFKGKFHKGFSARLGKLPKNLNLDRPIWVHAVSVGEALAVHGLIEELRRLAPGKKIVISTVTPTGNKIAQGLAREGDLVTYLPLDFSWIVKGVIERIRPSVFVIVETEIWPNLIRVLHKKRIPIITVNGRISDKSFVGYSRIRFLLKSALKMINLFCVQSALDADRLVLLGVADENIRVTGNMKFDNASFKSAEDTVKLRGRLGITSEQKLFVCGSTHPKEEEIILEAYKKILSVFPKLRLLIAPRHPHRAKEICQLVAKNNLSFALISKLPENQAPQAVFVLDTIGQLRSLYAAADIVFIGGSLIKKGGQNILEPAAFGKPVIFGPHMFNFRDIAGLYLSHRAAILVKDAQELAAQTEKLLKNPAKAAAIGEAGKALILSQQGASAKNAQYIKEYFI